MLYLPFAKCLSIKLADFIIHALSDDLHRGTSFARKGIRNLNGRHGFKQRSNYVRKLTEFNTQHFLVYGT